jgi:hypothetical protein
MCYESAFIDLKRVFLSISNKNIDWKDKFLRSLFKIWFFAIQNHVVIVVWSDFFVKPQTGKNGGALTDVKRSV